MPAGRGWRVRGQGCRQPPRLRHDPIPCPGQGIPWSNESSMMTNQAGPRRAQVGAALTAQYILGATLQQSKAPRLACLSGHYSAPS
jgi:hypothetical protein